MNEINKIKIYFYKNELIYIIRKFNNSYYFFYQLRNLPLLNMDDKEKTKGEETFDEIKRMR